MPTLHLLMVLYRLCGNGLSKPGLAYELPGDESKTLSKRRVCRFLYCKLIAIGGIYSDKIFTAFKRPFNNKYR